MSHRLIASLVAFTLLSDSLCAATFDVTSNADSGANTLRDAINQANSTAGPNTITFNGGTMSVGTITLASPLPIITQTGGLTITGPSGGQVIDGNNLVQVFFVGTGEGTPLSVSMSDLTINQGRAQGGSGGNAGGGGGLGAGGALFAADGAQISLSNVVFSNNQAVGGTGGASSNNAGGGGGGFSGSGGSGYNSLSVGVAGGGGGGLRGVGGNAEVSVTPGAGGGGGFLGAGANGSSGNGGGGGGTTSNGTLSAGGANCGGGGGGRGGDPPSGTGTAGGAGGGPGGCGANGTAGTNATGPAIPGVGGSGGAGGTGGGGGGGGSGGVYLSTGFTGGNGGSGGIGAGGGGASGSFTFNTAGSGGSSLDFGGGGGGAFAEGGQGGFGGGGGGSIGTGGHGGFGGGGGGGTTGSGTGGFGGGNGGASPGGGGGAGLGGALFVQQGAAITLTDPTLSANSVSMGTGSSGGSNGQALGADLFLMAGSNPTAGGTAIFDISGSLSIGTMIASDQPVGGGFGGGIEKMGAGTLTLTTANTYTGSTTLSDGILSVQNDSFLGDSTAEINFDGGTLHCTPLLVLTTNRAVNLLSTGTITTTQEVALNGEVSGVGGITFGNGIIFLATNSYSGTTTVDTASIYYGSNASFGTGSFVFSGNGTIINSDVIANFNHPMTINSGVNATINTEDTLPKALTFLSAINGTGGALTKAGLGTLTLTQANGYDGGTTIQAGTLALSGGGSLTATGSVQINAAASFSIAGISATTTTIGDLTAPAGAFLQLGGRNLTFGTSNSPLAFGGLIQDGGLGGSLTKQGSGTFTISTPVANTYSGGTTIKGGILSISAQNQLGTGNVSFTGNSTLQLTAAMTFSPGVSIMTGVIGTIDVGANPTTMSGVISGGGALQKIGSATLSLTNQNTYTGGTIISAGTLALLSPGTLNATGNVTINTMGTFDISGAGSGVTIGALSGDATGFVNLGSNALTTGNASSTSFGGLISGVGGSLIKRGTGTLNLQNAMNSYTGTATVNQGTLAVSTIGAFPSGNNLTVNLGTFDASSITTLTIGDLSGIGGELKLASMITTVGTSNSSSFAGLITGSGGFTKVNSGTLTLFGINAYTGLTTISGGSLVIKEPLPSGNNLTITSGTFNASAVSSLTLGDVSATGGTFNLATQTTLGTANSTSFAGVIQGSGALIKQGAGTFTITTPVANTYSGGTTINDGILSISALNQLGTGNVNFSGNSTLQLTSAMTVSLGVSIGSGVIGTIDSGANPATMSGVISGSGTLQKIGSATLSLTGQNTYSGGTVISAGTLALLSPGTLNATGDVTINTMGTFDISGAGSGVTIGALSGDATGFVNLGSNALTTGDTSSTSFGGLISGVGGSLIKQGTGTLNLQNAMNSYTGTTTVNQGTLAVSVIGAFPSGNNLTVNLGIFDASALATLTIGDLSGAGGELKLASMTTTAGTANSTSFSGSITGSGGFTKVNSGTLTLSGTNAYTGLTTVSGGSLVIQEPLPSGNNLTITSGAFDASAVSSLTLGDVTAAGGTFDLAVQTILGTANSTAFAGVIQGSGALIKQGSGTFTLSNANTYSGGTTINAGTLALTGAGALFSGGNLNINTGTFDISTAAGSTTVGVLSGTATTLTGFIALGAQTLTVSSGSFGGTISGVGGSLIKQSSGTLILSGTSTYSGGTTVSGGILQGTTTSLQGAILNNAGVVFDQVGMGTYAGNMSGSGTLTLQNGDVSLSGMNSYTGLTTVNNGTLTILTAASFPSGNNLTINGGEFDASALATLTIGDLSGTSGMLNFASMNTTLGTANSTAFSGVVSGGGSLTKVGTGTLALSGTNTYLGDTFLTNGTLAIPRDASLGISTGIVHFNGMNPTLQITGMLGTISSREFNLMTAGTIEVSAAALILNGSPVFTGTGALTKTGLGALIVEGDSLTYGGSVTVANGFLFANGALPVPITVNPLAFLGGTGSVGAILNNGIVAPGNSPGVLTAAAYSGSGTLLIEVDPHAAVLKNSQLLVTPGAADISASTLDVILLGPVFAGADTYTIVDATLGGVTGQFPVTHIPSGLSIVYTPTTVLLQSTGNNVLPHAPQITEHNPAQVLHYLESLHYFANGQPIPSQEDLIGVIIDMARLNGDQQIKALDQLHPAQFGEFGLLTSDVRSYIASFLNRHSQEQCCKHLVEACVATGTTIWMEPFGLDIWQKPVHDERGFHAWTGGLVLGGDYCFMNNIVLGLALGGNATYLNWSGGMGHAHFPSGFVALYADYARKWGYIEASVLGGIDFFKQTRHIHFTGVHRNAKSRHRGYDLNAHLGGGWDIKTGPVYLQPFFNLDYSFLHQDHFKEHGAQSLNLSVSDKSFGFLRAEEGISLTKSFKTRHGCWFPKIWMSLITSIPLYNRNYTSSLQGQDQTFTVWTYHRTVNRFSPGAEVTWDLNGAVTLSARYGAEIGSDLFEQKADLRVEWGF